VDCSERESDSKTNGNFDKAEWKSWLDFISKFFSCYSVTSIHDSHNTTEYVNSRPYVAVDINGITTNGLLDTGSSVTILGQNYHTKFLDAGFKLDNTEYLNFVAAGGQTLNNLGVINLPVSFLDQLHILKVYVVPEIHNPLILGMDFWRLFNLFPEHLDSVMIGKETVIPDILSISTPTHICDYDHLSTEQKVTADHITAQFRDISYEERGLGRTSLITHSINTGDAPPIRQRYYRMSPEKQRLLVTQLDEMLRENVVEPCESPWSSPVLLTPKKNGELRLCLDSRKLNAVTVKDAYSIPYISEILDNLRDAKYLSSLDLSKSFWQIPITEEDRCKTAFYIPSKGTFQFTSMAFGLTNAPATQQRLVDMLFYGPEFENKVFVYIDDIIIVSPTFEQHIFLLVRVLEKLRMANLTISYKKCQFFRNKLKYLGYVVDHNGLHPDPEKVEAIINYPTPTNRKEVRRFIGTASWYRRFIPNFSTIASPLNKLTTLAKNSPPFNWSSDAEKAFRTLKEALISSPVLSCPDFSQAFQVHTDASDFGVGAVLTQILEGEEKVIAYMSKSLSSKERNYSATEREALAVLTAIEHWRCYLENGKTFIVYTDHSSLKWFLNLNNPTGRLARWGVRMSSFDFDIKHRRGSENVVPDSLSRSVPIATIDQDSSNHDMFYSTDDTWYLNIYHGCQNAPTSFLNYKVTNGKLFRYKKSLNPLTREFEWKEVIPSEFRSDIIAKNHTDPTSGHFGIYKTHKRLSLNYFWPDMHRDISKFVTTCDTCCAHKYPAHATLGIMGRPKDCARPFQMLSMDLIGPLPPSRKQNTFIFVIQCCFSKYCLLFPIRRATSEIIAKLLEEEVFLVHGVPSTVLMDNGKQFVGNTLKQLYNKYNIPNVKFTPKYTPQFNCVERYNKTLLTAVSTYIENDHRSWDCNLSKIQFAMNSSVNEVTGYTPAFLVYGRELVTTGLHYIDTELSDDIIYTPRDEYAENLGNLRTIFEKVQSCLTKAHTRNSGYYNLRRKDVNFNIGDIIWKKTFYLSNKNKMFCKKLAPKFTKCKVVNKKSNLVYELEDMKGNNIGDWHVKDFKLINYKQ
jgi:hypothetical protein